jgi:hypothetical protein
MPVIFRKPLETASTSQNPELLEGEVAKFAKAGKRRWRTKGIDVELVSAAPGVQKHLLMLASDEKPDANAIWNAVEAAIEAAIETLPEPYQSAALDEFGFSNDLVNRGDREERATEHFDFGVRTYRKPSARFEGRSPQDHLIWLVTCALAAPPSHRMHRLTRFGFAIATLCGIALGGYLLTSQGDPSKRAQAGSAGHGGYTPAGRAVFRCIRKPECPGPNYPVFNSYTNAPNYGNEQDFLNVRRLHAQAWSNGLAVTSGEEVVLRVYYDNDGDQGTEPQPGAATARDTRVTVLLPHLRSREMNVAANITASNTHPHTIGDTVTLRSTKPFDLIYMPRTAYLWNRAYPHGLPLPNNLFDTGTSIGYEKMNGTIAGCFCQSGLITLHLLVE